MRADDANAMGRRALLAGIIGATALAAPGVARAANNVGPLQPINNLADVDDPIAARNNLGGIPIVPVSSSLPIGWSGILYNNSGVAIVADTTVAGSGLEIYVDNGAIQTGTWMNITGADVANGIAGLFVRKS